MIYLKKGKESFINIFDTKQKTDLFSIQCPESTGHRIMENKNHLNSIKIFEKRGSFWSSLAYPSLDGSKAIIFERATFHHDAGSSYSTTFRDFVRVWKLP